jgi:hypothetical protein
MGKMSQIDIQSLYVRMFERDLSARKIEYSSAVLDRHFARRSMEGACKGIPSLAFADFPRQAQGDGSSERRRVPKISGSREKSEWRSQTPGPNALASRQFSGTKSQLLRHPCDRPVTSLRRFVESR